MADDNKVNINLNVTNSIKTAQQQISISKQNNSDNNKLQDNKSIIPQITIQSSKFIEELSKSKLFQNIDSSLNKVSQNVQNLSNNSFLNISQLQKNLLNIQTLLKANQTNNLKDYNNLPQIFANNSFFKQLFDNLTNINLMLKTQYLNKQQKQENTSENLDPFFENINSNLVNFSNKFDLLIQVIKDLNLQNIISKDDLSNLLSDYKFSISDQSIQQLNTNINSLTEQTNNTEILEKINNLEQLINMQLDIFNDNKSVLISINENILNLNNNILDQQNNNQQQVNTEKNIIESINLNITQQKKQTESQLSNILANTNISLNVNSNIKPIIQNTINQQQPAVTQNENNNISQSVFDISDNLIQDIKNILDNYKQPNNININTQSKINILNNQNNEIETQNQIQKQYQNQNQNLQLENNQEQIFTLNNNVNADNFNENNDLTFIPKQEQNQNIFNNEQTEQPELTFEQNQYQDQTNDLLTITSQNIQNNQQKNLSLQSKQVIPNTYDNQIDSQQDINIQMQQQSLYDYENPFIEQTNQVESINSSMIQNKNQIPKSISEEIKISKIETLFDKKEIPEIQLQQKSEKELQKKQNTEFNINTQVQSLYQNFQNDIIDIDEDNDIEQTDLDCKILTNDAEKTKLQQLLNSNNIQSIKHAINQIQQQIKRLTILLSNKQYEQYFERISIYIKTLQSLLSIAQKKLKKLNENSNIKNAAQQSKNINNLNKSNSNKLSNSANNSLNEVIEIFNSVDSNSNQSKIDSSSNIDIKQLSQNKQNQQDNKNFNTSDKKILQDEQNGQDEQTNQQNKNIQQIVNTIKLQGELQTNYCKEYIKNVLIDADQKSYEISNIPLSLNKLKELKNNALDQFLIALKNNNILVYDSDTKQKNLFTRKDIEKIQQEKQFETIIDKKIKQPNKKQSDNNQQNKTLTQDLQTTKESSQNNNVDTKKQIQTTQKDIKDLNKQQKVDIVQSKSQNTATDQKKLEKSSNIDIYKAEQQTDNTQYNEYIENAKQSYIDGKNDIENKNSDAQFDKKSSLEWQQAYKKGNIISLQYNEDTQKYETKNQKVSDLKEKFKVEDKSKNSSKDSLTKTAESISKQFFQTLDSLQDKTINYKDNFNKADDILSKPIQKVNSNFKDNNLLKNASEASVKKEQITASAVSQSASTLSNSIANASTALTQQSSVTDIDANNSLSQKPQVVNLSSIKKELMDLKTICMNTCVNTVYIPATKDGVKPVILNNFNK